jgi:hypothetical protein
MSTATEQPAPKPPYRLITAGTVTDLERAVAAAIAEGYVPIGGALNASAFVGGYAVSLAQTVVLSPAKL